MSNISNIFVTIISGVILFLFTLFILTLRLKNKKIFDFLDWIILAIGFFNGLCFIFVIIATYYGKNTNINKEYIMRYTIGDIINFTVSNIILILAILYGWYIFKSLAKKRDNKVNVNIYSYLFIIKIVAWIMLFIGILAYFIYSIPYGGFWGVLEYSTSIRSGVLVINNKFSFLQRFGSFPIFSSLIFYSIIIDKKLNNTKKRINTIGLIVSIIFSVYYLYSLDGRISMLLYLVTFFLSSVLYKGKKLIYLFRKLLTILFISIISILGIDNILGRSDRGISTVGLFCKELSFPFISYIVQLQYTEFRWFKDMIIAPIFILPMKIWSSLFHIESITSINTLLVSGYRKGEGGQTGSMPVDMITFAKMQAPVIGLLVVGLFWGGLLYFIYNKVKNIPLSGFRSVIYASIVLKVVVLSVLYADPQHIIARNFETISGFILILIFLYFKKGREQVMEKNI